MATNRSLRFCCGLEWTRPSNNTKRADNHNQTGGEVVMTKLEELWKAVENDAYEAALKEKK